MRVNNRRQTPRKNYSEITKVLEEVKDGLIFLNKEKAQEIIRLNNEKKIIDKQITEANEETENAKFTLDGLKSLISDKKQQQKK